MPEDRAETDREGMPEDSTGSAAVLLAPFSPGGWSLESLLEVREVLRDTDGDPLLRRAITVELALRGVGVGPLPAPPDDLGASVPSFDRARLDAGWARLSRERGRIPFPARVTELWAQHKYSMMARDPHRGRMIGAALGAQDPAVTIETLLPELTAMLRTPPRAGTLRDAVMHMWGYVSPVARGRGVVADFADIPATVARIGEIAMEDPTGYLARSTALGDLAIWGNGVIRENGASRGNGVEGAS